MNRRIYLLALYIVAGVLMSAYGASAFLSNTAQHVAEISQRRAVQMVGAE
jgi:hypothetical protein